MPNDILHQVNQPRANAPARTEVGAVRRPDTYQVPFASTPEQKRARRAQTMNRAQLSEVKGRQFPIDRAADDLAAAKANVYGNYPKQQEYLRLTPDQFKAWNQRAGELTAHINYRRNELVG
jgi:hypothetical protein